MKELKTQEDCINFIGKETIVKFDYASDNMLIYKSVTPIEIDEEYVNFELSIFCGDGDTFFCYEPLGKLMFKKQIFELKLEDPYGKYNTVFCEVYNKELMK